MGVKLVASSNGSVELVPANTASNFTITVPAKTGTMAMDGPAFSVSSTALVSAAASTFTKITYDTEDFDTNSNFATSRFTPTVAGYYQLNASITFSANSLAGSGIISLYKNGSRFLDGQFLLLNSIATQYLTVSGVIYFNGSTDYVEVYGVQTTASSMNIGSAQTTSKFTGAMVRGA